MTAIIGKHNLLEFVLIATQEPIKAPRLLSLASRLPIFKTLASYRYISTETEDEITQICDDAYDYQRLIKDRCYTDFVSSYNALFYLQATSANRMLGNKFTEEIIQYSISNCMCGIAMKLHYGNNVSFLMTDTSAVLGRDFGKSTKLTLHLSKEKMPEKNLTETTDLSAVANMFYYLFGYTDLYDFVILLLKNANSISRRGYLSKLENGEKIHEMAKKLLILYDEANRVINSDEESKQDKKKAKTFLKHAGHIAFNFMWTLTYFEEEDPRQKLAISFLMNWPFDYRLRLESGIRSDTLQLINEVRNGSIKIRTLKAFEVWKLQDGKEKIGYCGYLKRIAESSLVPFLFFPKFHVQLLYKKKLEDSEEEIHVQDLVIDINHKFYSKSIRNIISTRIHPDILSPGSYLKNVRIFSSWDKFFQEFGALFNQKELCYFSKIPYAVDSFPVTRTFLMELPPIIFLKSWDLVSLGHSSTPSIDEPSQLHKLNDDVEFRSITGKDTYYVTCLVCCDKTKMRYWSWIRDAHDGKWVRYPRLDIYRTVKVTDEIRLDLEEDNLKKVLDDHDTNIIHEVFTEDLRHNLYGVWYTKGYYIRAQRHWFKSG